MSLSTDVNLNLLNDCYELGPFHGFRKPHDDDQLAPSKTPTPSQTPQAGIYVYLYIPLLLL